MQNLHCISKSHCKWSVLQCWISYYLKIEMLKIRRCHIYTVLNVKIEQMSLLSRFVDHINLGEQREIHTLSFWHASAHTPTFILNCGWNKFNSQKIFPFLLSNFKSYVIKYDTKVLPFISYVRYSLGIFAVGGTKREDAAALENERRYCFISHLLQECTNGEKF